MGPFLPSLVLDPMRVAHKVDSQHARKDFQGFQLDIDFHWKTHGFKMQPKIHMSGPHMLPVNITEVSVKDVELTTTGSVLLAPLISEDVCRESIALPKHALSMRTRSALVVVFGGVQGVPGSRKRSRAASSNA